MPSPFLFTIQMDSEPRAYVPLDDQSPRDVFEKTMSFIDTIQSKLNERGDDGMDIISENVTAHLGFVIFGSNNIERAGLGLEETIIICEQVFKGQSIDPENILYKSVYPQYFWFRRIYLLS